MPRLTSMIATTAGAVLLAGGAASAGLVAEYVLDGGAHNAIAETTQVLDSAGPLLSGATDRINFPRWWGDMGAGTTFTPDLPPIPGHPDWGAPANGKALRLGQSHGFRFGQGADDEIANALSQGPFTLVMRLLNDGGDLLVRKNGTFNMRFNVTSASLFQLDVVTYQRGTPTGATHSSTRSERGWSDIVLRFDPDTPATGLQTFVNGELAGQMSVLPEPLDAGTGAFEFEQARGGTGVFTYMESLRLYDHALSDLEIAQLSSVVPEPAAIGGLTVAGLGLLARRRR